MCKKLTYLISSIVLLGLATSSVSVGALIQDDFEADTLDLSKWQVLSGPDVTITQAGGQVIFDRPQAQLSYLVTTEQYDPAVTPLTITGSAVTDPEGLAIWTRASNIGNTAASAQHVLDSGIRIPLWPAGQAGGWYDGEIIEKTAGTWPWSGLATGNMPGEEAYDWDFVVTDDGTTITATFTQSSDPNNTFTLTAESTTDFDTYYIAITVVNGYLNDITITAEEPQVGLVVTNGTFDGGEPADVDVPDWYDLDTTPAGNIDWWNTASICGLPIPSLIARPLWAIISGVEHLVGTGGCISRSAPRKRVSTTRFHSTMPSLQTAARTVVLRFRLTSIKESLTELHRMWILPTRN
jgi:hypothetical protein